MLFVKLFDSKNLALPPHFFSKDFPRQKIFGSNLILQNQKVSGTAHPLYAAVAAARENSGVSDSVSVLVLGGRLELPCLAAIDPKSIASTNFATPAMS